MQVKLTNVDAVGGNYVLQTRLRTRGSKIRLESRLNAEDGIQVWTGKHDGELEDIFDWQDQTGEALAAQVMGIILDLEFAKLRLIREEDLTPEQHYLAGIMKFRALSEEAFVEVATSLSRAIELKPDYVAAYGELITMTMAAQTVGWTSLSELFAKVPNWVEVARGLKAQTPLLELAIAFHDFSRTRKQIPFRSKISELMRRLPSNVRLLVWSGWSFLWMGEPQLALDCFEKFRRIGRFDPLLVACEGGSALALAMSGNDESAIRVAERGMQISTHYPTFQMVLAASHARLGNEDESQRYVQEYLTLVPGMTMVERRQSFYAGTQSGDRFLDALELAGVPLK